MTGIPYRLLFFNTLILLWGYAPIRPQKKLPPWRIALACVALISLRLPFYIVFNKLSPTWFFTMLRLVPTAVFLALYKGLDWKRCLYFSSLTWVGFTLCTTVFSSPWLNGLTLGKLPITDSALANRWIGALLEHGTQFVVITLLTRVISLNEIRTVEKDRAFLLAFVIFCESYLVQTLAVLEESAWGIKAPQLTVYLIFMQTFIISGMLMFERYHASNEARVRAQMLDLASQYRYEALKARQTAETDVRRLHHDMKNHLIAIRSMACDAQQLDAYTAQLLDRLKGFEVLKQTGNELLDGLLSEKNRAAAAQGVELCTSLDFRPCIYMESIDVCTIFGNILDNAIEACARVEVPCQRRITLQGKAAADQLVITCTNTYTGKLSQTGGLPLTSKSNTSLHGFGLSNVQRSVEKYGGSMLIDTGKAGLFRIVLLFPTQN